MSFEDAVPAASAQSDSRLGKRPLLQSRHARLSLLTGLVPLVAAVALLSHFQTMLRFRQTTDDALVGSDTIIVSSMIAGHVERMVVADDQHEKASGALIRPQIDLALVSKALFTTDFIALQTAPRPRPRVIRPASSSGPPKERMPWTI